MWLLQQDLVIHHMDNIVVDVVLVEVAHLDILHVLAQTEYLDVQVYVLIHQDGGILLIQ
jgi:hypothetical protein